MEKDNCPLGIGQRNSLVGTETAEQAMHVIQHSNTIGFLPQLLMKDLARQGRVIKVEMPEWPRVEQPIYMGFRTDAITEIQYRAFSRALRRVLAADRE